MEEDERAALGIPMDEELTFDALEARLEEEENSVRWRCFLRLSCYDPMLTVVPA